MPTGVYVRTKIQSIEERLSSRTVKTDTCWLWTGGKTKFGHGVIFNGSYSKELPSKAKLPAHRVAYELKFGRVPQNLCALHKCDVPNCVNPDHIFIGTKLDNSRDMVSKNRSKKGNELPQSKLTEEQVIEIRKSDAYQRDLAIKYGVSQATICMIRQRKRWNHVP